MLFRHFCRRRLDGLTHQVTLAKQNIGSTKNMSGTDGESLKR